MTAITFTIDEVLLGSASHGSGRSWCPHLTQTPRRPSRTSSPSQRLNHVPVSSSSRPPHAAHSQPARSVEVAVAITSRYVVTSIPGT